MCRRACSTGCSMRSSIRSCWPPKRPSASSRTIPSAGKRAIAGAPWRRILGDRVIQSVVEAAVTDKAINDLYREHQALAAQTEEFHARQIVSATEADAQVVRKQLAGGAAFDALAMEKSIDATTRFNGGDLGYFTADMMPAAYSAAALASAQGRRYRRAVQGRRRLGGAQARRPARLSSRSRSTRPGPQIDPLPQGYRRGRPTCADAAATRRKVKVLIGPGP